MKTRIVESFCRGKFGDDRNEDRIYAGQNHIAVIDGSSAAEPIAGRAGGIVAAETVADVLGALAPEATASAFVGAVSAALGYVARPSGSPSPYAAAVVLSPRRREIWRVGDCAFSIDGQWNIPPHNPHEQAFFAFRRMMMSDIGNAKEEPVGGAEDGDVASRVTAAWLKRTKSWVNAHDDPFSFAALDERPPPAQFVEVFPVVQDAKAITLASDGAVVSVEGQRGPATIAGMLAQIAEVRSKDPLCLELFPYWRGFLDGASLLDDTSFVRIALDS